jgi:CheY-like chemotaxis protein
MPKMDGLEFIQEMRKQERFNTIPVIVFSAKPVQESQDRISQLRVDKFVMKPSTLDCLLESIEELLNS